MKAKEIWFVKGRLKFDDQEGSAPFPSAVVVFQKHSGAIFPQIRAVNSFAGFL